MKKWISVAKLALPEILRLLAFKAPGLLLRSYLGSFVVCAVLMLPYWYLNQSAPADDLSVIGLSLAIGFYLNTKIFVWGVAALVKVTRVKPEDSKHGWKEIALGWTVVEASILCVAFLETLVVANALGIQWAVTVSIRLVKDVLSLAGAIIVLAALWNIFSGQKEAQLSTPQHENLTKLVPFPVDVNRILRVGQRILLRIH